MFMQLLKYPGLVIKYVPGKELLVADCLSRASLPETVSEDQVLKFVVHSLIRKTCMADHNKLEFVRATKADESLCKILSYIDSEWPLYKNLGEQEKKFHKIKSELSTAEGLLFFRDRLVVPSELRKQTLRLLHTAHLGIEKTRMRARQLYYWPGLSSDVEKFVSECRICEGMHKRNPKEPLQLHPEPYYAWEQVAMDIFEHSGASYLAIIDSCSGWLVSEKLKNKSVSEIIKVLKQLCFKVGFPTEIRSDNVPFNSREFINFANDYNVKLKFSSPNYPQSNGLAEKAVSIAKNILRKNKLDGKHDYHEQILEYNVTPLQDMLLSPAQLFMGRTLKTKHPVSNNLLCERGKGECYIRDQIVQKRNKQQLYYNKSARPLGTLSADDKVLFWKNNGWQYGIIVEAVSSRTYIVKDVDGNTYRRNRRLLRNTKNQAEDRDMDYIDQYNGLSNNEQNFDNECENRNEVEERVICQDRNNIGNGNSSDDSEYEDAGSPNTTDNSSSATNSDMVEEQITRAGRVVHRPQLYGEWEHY